MGRKAKAETKEKVETNVEVVETVEADLTAETYIDLPVERIEVDYNPAYSLNGLKNYELFKAYRALVISTQKEDWISAGNGLKLMADLLVEADYLFSDSELLQIAKTLHPRVTIEAQKIIQMRELIGRVWEANGAIEFTVDGVVDRYVRL